MPWRDHDFHTKTYFTTYKVHLRITDRWIALLDNGRMTSLDDPEVLALASRYGDPSGILAEDWIPKVPGVNAPGDYAQYAADPWKYSRIVLDRALNGTHAHFYPQGGPKPIDMERVFAAGKSQKARVSGRAE